MPIAVVQGGLFDPSGSESYGAAPAAFSPVPHETTEATGLKHLDGTLSMARMEPGSATAEFFISVGDNPELDFGGKRNPDGQGFAAFGRVTAGMDVVRAIHIRPTRQAVPDELARFEGQILDPPVAIRSVTRREVASHCAAG